MEKLEVNKIKIRSSVETITPEIAREYLRQNLLNRPVRQRLVAFYADQMLKGQWELNGEPIIIARSGRVLDGQHRLHAIVLSAVTIESVVTHGVVDNAFDTIDQGVSRTGGDILSIAGVKDANNISAIIARRHYLKTYSMLVDGGRGKESGLSKRDILYHYKRSPSFWEDILRISDQCYTSKRLFTRTEIGGATAHLILDKRHKKEVVFSFFKQLTGVVGVTNNTIRLLADKIIDASLKGYKLKPKYKTALLIKTFNAYLSGKEYKVLSYSEANEKYPSFF